MGIANFSTSDDFLAQTHVDIRNFHQGEYTFRPLSQLDQLTMAAIEGDISVDDTQYDTVIELEEVIKTPSENWTSNLDGGGDGFNTPLTVGAIQKYKNWRGLTTTTNGNAIDADIWSSVSVDSSISGSAGLDISDQSKLLVVFPDFSDFDASDCYVQLSSHHSGGFDADTGNPDEDNLSDTVTFDSSTGDTSSSLILDLGDFIGVGFDNTSVTGILFHFSRAVAPSADLDFTILGVRAIGNTWTPYRSDIDTRHQGVSEPISIDGLDYLPDQAFIPIVRGNDDASDPKPSDSSLLMYFNTGGRYNLTLDDYVFCSANTLTSLTSLWVLADNGDPFANDIIGSNTGVYTGSPTQNADGGLWDDIKSTQFSSSTSDFVQIAHDSSLNPTTFGLFAWVKRSSASGSAEVIFDSRQSDTKKGFKLGIDSSGHVVFGVGDGSAYSESTGTTVLNTTDWYFIAASYDGTSRVLWVNDVKEYTAADSYSANTTGDAYIARGVAGNYFNGSIQYVGLADTPISDFQARRLYSEGKFQQRYNIIEGIFREREDSGINSYLVARLMWNNTETIVETEARSYESGVLTISDTQSTTLTGALTPADDSDQDAGYYLFRADLVGNQFTLQVWNTDSKSVVGTAFNTSPVISSNSNYTKAVGRSGFYTEFVDRDAILLDLSASAASYATMTSVAFPSRTPVRGARLVAGFSGDNNLFSTWSDIVPAEFYIDQTKSLSGKGSRRTSSGLLSNHFTVDDWDNLYLEMDIWVGPGVNTSNSPQISIISNNDTLTPTMPTLLPSQWNHVYIELAPFKDYLTGVQYFLQVQPLLLDPLLGPFWIDNPKIGRRTVRWQVRAESANPWRDFFGAVNDEWTAVNLGVGERGRNLQVQAIAVDQNGWVSNYRVSPAYSQLGAPLYE